MADFDPGAAYADERFFDNLFSGWGYNFYRAENQLRADDLMVRAKVSECLAAARAGVEAAESAYRRTRLPPPSRANPLPHPEALQNAQTLESLSRTIGALEGQIRTLPVPEPDRMTQRLRGERDTLERLLAADRALVAGAHLLQATLASATPESLLANNAATITQLTALSAALQSRRAVLQAPT